MQQRQWQRRQRCNNGSGSDSDNACAVTHYCYWLLFTKSKSDARRIRDIAYDRGKKVSRETRIVSAYDVSQASNTDASRFRTLCRFPSVASHPFPTPRNVRTWTTFGNDCVNTQFATRAFRNFSSCGFFPVLVLVENIRARKTWKNRAVRDRRIVSLATSAGISS